MMQAIVQRRYGDAGTWHLDELAVPEPGRGEVVVQVDAAAIDRGTWHLMIGEPWLARIAFGLRRPRQPVPGRDLAGTVAAAGIGVTEFAVGDRVVGTGTGSLAEYAVAPVTRLALLPAGVAPEQAAVLPVSGQTALQAVCDVAEVAPGERVLITGASGGVGTFAVQIAKAAGAEVTAVCSAAKAAAVRALGTDVVLDYRVDDPLSDVGRYDVIVDIGGRAALRRTRRALTRDGRLVIVGGLGGGKLLSGYDRSIRAALWSPFVSQRLSMLASTERGSDVQRLVEMVTAGTLRPPVDAVVPLVDAPDAMRSLAAGDVTGKLAISVT
jgi:NADPH:quinone reductase-like Zn-dependent oxidoreductase